MIILGTLAPDTALTQLLEEAADAQMAVAAAARHAHDREWPNILGPAVFATYTQAAVNAANAIGHVTERIAANRESAPLLVGQVHRVLEAQRHTIASLHERVAAYAAKATDPELKAAAEHMKDVSARIVATWDQMVANAAQIAANAEDPRTIDSLGTTTAHERWRTVSARAEELQGRAGGR